MKLTIEIHTIPDDEDGLTVAQAWLEGDPIPVQTSSGPGSAMLEAELSRTEIGAVGHVLNVLAEYCLKEHKRLRAEGDPK